MAKPLLGLAFLVTIGIATFFVIIYATQNRINPHPDCDRWHFAASTNTQVDTPQQALDVYQPYAATLSFYQDSSIPTNLAEFEQKFNHPVTQTTQTVYDVDGNQIAIEGYDMVLAHIVDYQGNIYQYTMCRHGQPLNFKDHP